MLRKLFISLLILSALTSDGLVNLPANIYNVYFQPHKSVDMCGFIGVQPQLSSEEGALQVHEFDAARSVFTVPRNAGYVLSSRSIEKLKGIVAVDITEKGNHFNINILATNFEYKLFPGSSKSIILNKADLSPPAC